MAVVSGSVVAVVDSSAVVVAGALVEAAVVVSVSVAVVVSVVVASVVVVSVVVVSKELAALEVVGFPPGPGTIIPAGVVSGAVDVVGCSSLGADVGETVRIGRTPVDSVKMGSVGRGNCSTVVKVVVVTTVSSSGVGLGDGGFGLMMSKISVSDGVLLVVGVLEVVSSGVAVDEELARI